MATASGAELLVRCLEAQGVRHVFCIPGAKVDKVLDCLVGTGIQTIVCRHEQNAALIAGEIAPKLRQAFETPGPVLINCGSTALRPNHHHQATGCEVRPNSFPSRSANVANFPRHGLRSHGDVYAFRFQLPTGSLDLRTMEDDRDFGLLPIGHHGLGIKDQARLSVWRRDLKPACARTHRQLTPYFEPEFVRIKLKRLILIFHIHTHGLDGADDLRVLVSRRVISNVPVCVLMMLVLFGSNKQ